MSPTTAALHYRACNLCEAICGIEIEHSGGEIDLLTGNVAINGLPFRVAPAALQPPPGDG